MDIPYQWTKQVAFHWGGTPATTPTATSTTPRTCAASRHDQTNEKS